MDADSLSVDADFVSRSGIVLSVEQKSALQTSLTILKSQQKFKAVKFWGKILGVKGDYFIVQGIGKDDLKDKKTLFSLDCLKWGLLQLPSDDIRRNCSLIKGRFTGDPSHEYEHSDRRDSEEKDENAEHDNVILVKEEDRLATVISAIDRDVSIAPRGAYMRLPTGEVTQNRCFEGLSEVEASRLSSYLHFRDPLLIKQKSLLEKANLDRAIDFLDPITEDIPKEGSWSIQFEGGNRLLILRNLHWLGFTFYHVPHTKKYGYVYFGTGEKNLDLPFML